MEKFASMLIEANLPIVEIAYGLGMDDLKNVSRKFKQINGFRPENTEKNEVTN